MNRIHIILLIGLLCGLAGCGGSAEDPAPRQVSEPIVNGNQVTNDTMGVVLVLTGTLGNARLCSGTLLSDRWVLTAQHCLTGAVNQLGQTGTLVTSAQVSLDTNHAQTVGQSGMFLHPTVDVALLHLNSSYFNTATGAPFSNPLYLGAASGLVGQTVLCLGYGNDTDQFMNGSGDGTLRSAYLQIAQMDGEDYRLVPTQGQITAPGDSGSSCFVYTGGVYNIIGVESYGAEGPSNTIAYSDQVAVGTFRDWAQGIMGNAVSVFSGNGFAGNSQQLVPGGPLACPTCSMLYDLPQLTIGNDNIRSWMAPPFPWFAALFANSGFQGTEITSDVVPTGTPVTVTGVTMQSGLSATTSSAEVSGSANLYSGAGFTGLFFEAPMGEVYTLPFAESVGSLTVPAGWTVSLFNSASPGNLALTFTEGSYGSVPAAYNVLSAGSTVTFREPAALYVDANFGNTVGKFLPGCYDLPELFVPNDSVSSVFVPSGLAVQLFQNAGFSGANELLTSTQSYVGNAWNDTASSACVYASPVGCGVMHPGQALLPNQALVSCDGRFSLWMQSDGNLVLYFGSFGADPLWAAGTNGLGGQIAVMQNDGNFVLYNSNYDPFIGYGAYGPGQGTSYAPAGTVPSNTSGNPGATLLLQNDGNLVVYSSSGTPLWATNTCCH